MNRIRQITSLPNLPWLPNSANEIALTGEELLDYSDVCYEIRGVAVVGFIYTNYLKPPWMWFALAQGITLGDLIDFRRLIEEIPQGTLTAVRSDFTLGFRFAKLYGFEETGEIRQHGETSYTIFWRI